LHPDLRNTTLSASQYLQLFDTKAATMPDDASELRPMWRPFVLRPAAYASVLPALALIASFFFWPLLHHAIGRLIWVAIGVTAVVPLFVLFERIVRYRKTSYELRPDKITVRTGSILSERSVELDIEKITLVEWTSPFILRNLYGCGHIVAQEAGSSEQPAQLNYIQSPKRVYDRIGEFMRDRGFKMSRNKQIQRETPGHLGATVDLVAAQFAIIWGVILALPQLALEALPLLYGGQGGLQELLTGDNGLVTEAFGADTFFHARIGLVLLGTVVILAVLGWLFTKYLDLLYRTYTLYDDVIDYEDGFLNETRRYIPLEALADTEVSHPLYKRIFGLSDVTLSSRGAENAIKFRSTPNGQSFAESIERFVDRSPTAAQRREQQRSEQAISDDLEATTQTPDNQADTANQRRVIDTDQAGALKGLSPAAVRAALRGTWTLPVTLLILAVTVLPNMLEAGRLKAEIGPYLFTGLVGIFAAGLILSTGAAVVTGMWWMVKAWAMEFSFDDRGAKYTYDLFSKEERRFAPEQITTVSIYRNPIDWLLGTMTLRFRSIGSNQAIDFWGIPYSFQTIDIVRDRLGISRVPVSKQSSECRPDYNVLDGILSKGPLYLVGLCITVVVIATSLWLGLPTDGALPGGALTVFAGLIFSHQVWTGVYHSRIDGGFRDNYLEVTGGVVRTFHHLAPFEHIKSVGSCQYPRSNHGRLTCQTAGFPLAISHLESIQLLHKRLDRALSNCTDSAGGEPAESFVAGAGTQALRWSWTLLFGIGIIVVPYVYIYYRLADYRLEPNRLTIDEGLYFDYRTTVLVEKVDHIESNRTFPQYLSNTHDIEIYTVGSGTCDLRFRSVDRSSTLLGDVKRRLES
jgi:uncharacterized membrane protein YdbT with pleckstrin-like domain